MAAGSGDGSLQAWTLVLAGLAALVVYLWPLAQWQRDRRKRGQEEVSARRARLAKFCSAGSEPSPSRGRSPSRDRLSGAGGGGSSLKDRRDRREFALPPVAAGHGTGTEILAEAEGQEKVQEDVQEEVQSDSSPEACEYPAAPQEEATGREPSTPTERSEGEPSETPSGGQAAASDKEEADEDDFPWQPTEAVPPVFQAASSRRSLAQALVAAASDR
eukprot:s1857_g1.t1